MNFNGVEQILKEVVAQKESLILEQLNDLISRGLLVVEQGPMSFIHDTLSTRVFLQQTIRLTLKDKEYIEKLETENKALNDRLNVITTALEGKI